LVVVELITIELAPIGVSGATAIIAPVNATEYPGRIEVSMGKKIAAALVPVVRLGIAEVEARENVDRSTISRWVRKGTFPTPHYLGRKRAWFLSEIELWEMRQMTRRGGTR
jgi:predicted DNA-binding transcriptional regulator AlpA